LGFAAAFAGDFTFFGNVFFATFFRISLRFLPALLREPLPSLRFALGFLLAFALVAIAASLSKPHLKISSYRCPTRI
jgi:hypothetical protein